MIVQGLKFAGAEDVNDIQMESPPTGVPNAGGVD